MEEKHPSFGSIPVAEPARDKRAKIKFFDSAEWAMQLKKGTIEMEQPQPQPVPAAYLSSVAITIPEESPLISV